jgi:hypothetical protein
MDIDSAIKDVIKSSFEKAAEDLGLTLKEFMQKAPQEYLDLLTLRAVHEYTDSESLDFNKEVKEVKIINFERGKYLWEK